MLFILLIQVQRYFCRKSGVPENYWLPLLITGIWLLNPFNVSTVAYIIQRMALLSALFSIISIILFIHGRTLLIERGAKGFVYIALSFAFIVIAMLCKENGILTAPLIAMIEVLLFRFEAARKLHANFIRWFFIISLIGAISLSIYLTPWLMNYIDKGYLFRDFNLTERILTQSRVLLYYINWFFIPNINELGLFHDDIPISESLLRPVSTLSSVVILLSSLIITFIFRNRQVLVFLGICWFFIGHALESTILPLEMIYEHRNYFPVIGLLLIVQIIFLQLLIKQPGSQTLVYFCMVLYLVILSFTTHLRASQWTDNVNFSYYEAMHHPESPRAQYGLGRIYANIALTTDEDYYDKAESYLKLASELDKDDIMPESSLLVLSSRLNKPADLRWFASLLDKLRTSKLSSTDLIALNELVQCTEENCLLAAKDLEMVFDAAFDSPNIDLPYSQRSDLLSIQAKYYTNHLADYESTEKVMLESIAIRPTNVQSYLNYIKLLIHIDDRKKARQYIAKVRKIDKLGTYSSQIKLLENKLHPKILNSDTQNHGH